MFREINCQKIIGFSYSDLIDQRYDIVTLFFSCCEDLVSYSVQETLKLQACILSHVSLYDHLQSPFQSLIIINFEMLKYSLQILVRSSITVTLLVTDYSLINTVNTIDTAS